MYAKLILLAVAMLCATNSSGQVLCAKQTVLQPITKQETVRVLLSPAIYETRWVKLQVKEGFWDVEYRNSVPCKVWREPQYINVQEQVMTTAALYKDEFIQRVVRQGDVITYMSECN